jgi:hypothetical protein
VSSIQAAVALATPICTPLLIFSGQMIPYRKLQSHAIYRVLFHVSPFQIGFSFLNADSFLYHGGVEVILPSTGKPGDGFTFLAGMYGRDFVEAMQGRNGLAYAMGWLAVESAVLMVILYVVLRRSTSYKNEMT